MSHSYLVSQELTTNVAGIDNLVDFQIEKPDGKVTKVSPQIGEGYYKINFKESDVPGIYSLYAQDRLVTQWAVNPDPLESDMTAIDRGRLKKTIGEAKIISIQQGDALASVVTTSRYGKELWKYLIGIALFFLIIEMLIARETSNVRSET
jgi:hypothetical protein